MRIALVQTDTVWHDKAANLAKARGFLAEAARAGARVAVFPELCTTGFTMAPETLAEPIPGPTTEAFAALAKQHGMYVVATAIERNAPRPCNAAFALSPKGELLAAYRKIHPFSFSDENRHYVGGDALPVFEIDGVKATLQICYDLRFPEPFRKAAERGVELVFVPANWPTRRLLHWSTLLAARAIENMAVVCGVNRAGRDPNVDYPGHSVVYDARGEVLALGGEGEQVVLADVDLAELRGWRAQFPALRDRRPAIYSQL